jgi:hypothetical protein
MQREQFEWLTAVATSVPAVLVSWAPGQPELALPEAASLVEAAIDRPGDPHRQAGQIEP